MGSFKKVALLFPQAPVAFPLKKGWRHGCSRCKLMQRQIWIRK
ncbi:hypothetical protein M832_06700 [Chlamydia avium 10DC88]|uniref:Uncharacterized protein n=1 Tax=Chlamydia avium 10DC88 TaxID=1229831 RepID=W8JRQ0_9CHLA|nr:hypothetical protein M832_06700 [Chlamydia avium 10DC88]